MSHLQRALVTIKELVGENPLKSIRGQSVDRFALHAPLSGVPCSSGLKSQVM